MHNPLKAGDCSLQKELFIENNILIIMKKLWSQEL